MRPRRSPTRWRMATVPRARPPSNALIVKIRRGRFERADNGALFDHHAKARLASDEMPLERFRFLRSQPAEQIVLRLGVRIVWAADYRQKFDHRAPTSTIGWANANQPTGRARS